MNSWIRGLSVLGLSTLTLISLSACESGEDRTMASAQSCLDGARDAVAAQRCVDIVQGLTTQDAYMVRCSAAFIANGFSGQKIADAYLAISDNGNTNADPMVSIMAYLNFTEPNFTSSAAVNNCQLSGVRSMFQLASAANLSSSITGLSPVPFDPQDPEASIQAAIDYIEANQGTIPPQDMASLGNVAIVANSAFCSGTSKPNEEICSKLGNAISTGTSGGVIDPAAVAAELMNLLH